VQVPTGSATSNTPASAAAQQQQHSSNIGATRSTTNSSTGSSDRSSGDKKAAEARVAGAVAIVETTAIVPVEHVIILHGSDGGEPPAGLSKQNIKHRFSFPLQQPLAGRLGHLMDLFGKHVSVRFLCAVECHERKRTTGTTQV
jgi:hypothetical protein